MGLVLVQLSDIHLSNNKGSNPILERTETLCGAIRSAVSPGDHCVIIISGDLADWGKPKEYELIEAFIKKIFDEISPHIHEQLHFVMVPGNHDLDFDVVNPAYDEQIRETIIGSISPKNPPNDMMIKLLLAPQEPYRDYINRIGRTIPVEACNELMENKDFRIRGFECPLSSAEYRLFIPQKRSTGNLLDEYWCPKKTTGSWRSTGNCDYRATPSSL